MIGSVEACAWMAIDSDPALLRGKAFKVTTGTDLRTLVRRVGSIQPSPTVIREELLPECHREGMNQIQHVFLARLGLLAGLFWFYFRFLLDTLVLQPLVTSITIHIAAQATDVREPVSFANALLGLIAPLRLGKHHSTSTLAFGTNQHSPTLLGVKG